MDRMSSKGAMVEDIRLGKIPTSGFDLAHHNFGTGKLGKIIPTMLDEVYPGDRIKGNPVCVINFEPLVAPVMGSMVTKQEGFFVPYYQIWRNAPKFFTEKKGFNTPVPSISPRGVINHYSNAGFLPLIGVLEEIGNAIFDESFDEAKPYVLNFKNEFANCDPTEALTTYGTEKFVLDLVQPIMDIYNRYNKRIQDLYDSIVAGTPFSAAYKREIAVLWDSFFADYLGYLFGASSLFDYLGYPFPPDWNEWSHKFHFNAIDVIDGVTDVFNYDFVGSISNISLPWTPFRAYYLVWYWNYRDQLLELDAYDPEEDDFLSDNVSQENCILCSLLRVRCWFKDAYTTALTNTGSGNFSVPADVIYQTLYYTYYDSDGNLVDTSDFEDALSAGATVCKVGYNDATISVPMNYLSGAQQGSWSLANAGNTNSNYSVSLDLFDRIRRLRAFTQKHLINGYEMDDVIWASFEVKLSNIRMHVPEILMRGRDAVEMNTIVNNTTTQEQIAGDKTATAYCQSRGSELNYFSEEWGLYIQNMSVMPVQTYPYGMKRLYLKRERLDFMWPEFATMGMDAVYNCELAMIGDLSDDDALKVFGYQGRYYDLKSRQDEAHGRMRTDMQYYLFGRKFDQFNQPKLNYIFVHCWPSLDMFVLDSVLDDVFRYDCYNAIAEQRKLPVASEIIG